MAWLQPRLQQHLLRCERDLMDCLLCQLIERQIFGD